MATDVGGIVTYAVLATVVLVVAVAAPAKL